MRSFHRPTFIRPVENCADPGFFQRRVGGGGAGVSIYALIISRSYRLVSTSLMICAVHVVKYRKIPKISPGACIFPRGALGYLLGGYVPPGTPNWHPVQKKFPLKLIPRSRNGPTFYTLLIRPKTDTRSRNGPIFYTPF